MIDTKKVTPSLFTIAFCEKVSLENLTFNQNWLSSGAISMFLAKEYLAWVDYENCDSPSCLGWSEYYGQTPFDIVFYEMKNMVFTGNKSGLNADFSGLIIVKA